MPLKLWTYDLAREQSASPGFLDRLARTTLEAGYDAIGLYLEHRFDYASAPWAGGTGVLTPNDVSRLRREFPSLRVIPFINLLGHTEGFLYTERGKRFAEERFKGLSACPSNPAFREFAKGILHDTLSAFDDEVVHVGGDETSQLGACDDCRSKEKADLYSDHFADLCQAIVDDGRRPALWGDMFLEHPKALERVPTSTLIFDWQYFDSPLETSRNFVEKGMEVVCCPTLHVYNSTWMNVAQSEANILQAHEARKRLEAGFCLTTWECALFGNYETLLPAVRWASNPEGGLAEAYGDSSDWARTMGGELVELGGLFEAGKIRSGLKCRLLLYGNPFLAWQHYAEELRGPLGERALAIAERALHEARTVDERGVAGFLKMSVLFVRQAEEARQAYAQELPGVAASSLAPCRQIFDELAKIATANHLNNGGSAADVERCMIAKRHIETVIQRIREYGAGQLGYLPAFEAITHHQFTPYDQGCWWRINSWGSS